MYDIKEHVAGYGGMATLYTCEHPIFGHGYYDINSKYNKTVLSNGLKPSILYLEFISSYPWPNIGCSHVYNNVAIPPYPATCSFVGLMVITYNQKAVLKTSW